MRPLPDRPRGRNAGAEEPDGQSGEDEDELSVDLDEERWLATQEF